MDYETFKQQMMIKMYFNKPKTKIIDSFLDVFAGTSES